MFWIVNQCNWCPNSEGTFEQRDDHRNLPVGIQGHFLTSEERGDSLGSAERHGAHSSPLLLRPCPQPSSLLNLRLNTLTSGFFNHNSAGVGRYSALSMLSTCCL